MPKNSKSPVQNVKQKVKTTFLDRLIQIIHSCRQGASCRLVVWSSHVGSMHMQSEEQEAFVSAATGSLIHRSPSDC